MIYGYMDWDFNVLYTLYHSPLFSLLSRAHLTHIAFHPESKVQMCALISVKTGGCQEDCKYCSQSSRYQTGVKAEKLLSKEIVMARAKKAKKEGATRICLGAAWREVRDNAAFDAILMMIKEISEMGLEVCATLGMLKPHQAKKLKEAGLHAYNHNLDSSERFYPTIITTRTYQDRLDTLKTAQQEGLTLCCGGILGMGEKVEDRLEMLLTLYTHFPEVESIPLNRLIPIEGTPLEEASSLSYWEFLRMVAVTRIVFPKAMVRLSAGRKELSAAEQTLCFFGGANSIFMGDYLLTAPNCPLDRDEELFSMLGLEKRKAYEKKSVC